MSTHILKLIPIREVMEGEQVEKKQGKRFRELSRIIHKFVTYYQDEDLKKMGQPYIWKE